VYFARIVLGGESFSQILINLDALAFYGKDPKHPPPMNSLWGDMFGFAEISCAIGEHSCKSSSY
jgi:hypothetical protein